MPFVETYPNTDGFEQGHHDAEIFIDGKPYSVSSISSEHGMERKRGHGSGQVPNYTTRGKYMPGELTISVTDTTFRAMLDAMGDDWMNKKFEARRTIVTSQGPTTDIWRGCTIDNESNDSEEGPDEIMHELTVGFEQHIPHGKKPVAAMADV